MTEERSAPWWNDVEGDPTHEAAAGWLMRLQDPQVSLEDALAWQRWIAADARHAQAFARIETTYRVMGEMRRPALASELAGAEHATVAFAERYDPSISVSHWLRAAPKVFWWDNWSTRVMAAAGAGVVLGLTWLIIGGRFGSDASRDSATQWLRTGIGEDRSASLPDGSQVILGGATELAVSFDAKARQVKLLRGEAFFVVAKDAARPFTVRAGHSDVTAVGTQFNVRRRNDRIAVAVVEGRVRVEPAPLLPPLQWLRELRPVPQPIQVNAGQQTIVGTAEAEPAVTLAVLSAVTSWRAGRMAFDREPLRDVLEDVNRYASKPIVVSDDTTGALEITGTVSRADIDGWVQSLERAFALEAVEETDRIVIRQRLKTQR